MNIRDEQRIAQGLRDGDLSSWHDLYDALADSIWRIVSMRLGSDSHGVADVVQETFIEAARSARNYDPERGQLRLWLGGIARRQSSLYLRRQRQQIKTDGSVQIFRFDAVSPRALLDHLEGSDPAPEELLEREETAEVVRAALSQLPADYEQLLAAKYMDGLSMDDLTREYELSLEAVRSKLARARRSFRRVFEEMTEQKTEN